MTADQTWRIKYECALALANEARGLLGLPRVLTIEGCACGCGGIPIVDDLTLPFDDDEEPRHRAVDVRDPHGLL